MVARFIATNKPSEKRLYYKMQLPSCSDFRENYADFPKQNEFLNAHKQFYCVLSTSYINFPLNIKFYKNNKRLM